MGLATSWITGLLVGGAGLAWLSRLSGPDGSYLGDIVGPALVVGVGFGLAFVAGMVAATTGAPAHQSGLASGLVNTSQQVGAALGLAVLVSIAAARTQSVAAGSLPAAAMTEGFRLALLVGAGFAVAAATLAAVLLPRAARPDPPPRAQLAGVTGAGQAGEP